MKGFFALPQVLLIVGGVLFLSGQTLLATSFLQGTQGDVMTLPPGAGWSYVYEFKVLGAGRVAGQFASTTGGPLNLYVFGEAQYRRYSDVGIGESLYAARGSGDSFSTDLPGPGTYYLVVAHGDGSEYAPQAVRVSFRVAGIQPDLIGVGFVLISAGILGIDLALWQRARRRRNAQPAA